MNFNLYINKIKNHYLAIVVCVFFTLAIISPRIISQFIVGDEFKGIYPTFVEDEMHYASRIKEVTNGRFILGNPYIKEHQDDVFIQPPLSEWIMALPVYLTGLPVSFVIILSNFFIIPIFFLLSYFFIYLINKNKIQSIVLTSLFFLIFYQTFGRPISPQLNFIFLLCGLVLIFDIYHQRHGWFGININNILYGVFTGICIFISPYYFTTLVVVYGLVSLHKLFICNIKSVFFESFCFIVSLSPFVVLYGFFLFRANKVSGYIDVSTRFGMINSHWPGSYTNIIFGIFSVLVLLIARKFIKKNDWYLGAIFATSIFVLNWQNVITGQALQFPSHYLVVTMLFVITSIAYALGSIDFSNNPYKDKKNFLVLVAIVMTIAMLIIRQKREFTVLIPSVPDKQTLIDLQKDKAVFEWLNKNTPTNSVVNVLGEDLNSKIILYTNNKVFYNRYGALYLVSDYEVYNRWLIQNYFVPKIDKDFVVNNQKYMWWNRYVDSYFFYQNKYKILSKLFGIKTTEYSMIPDNAVFQIIKMNNEIHNSEIKSVLHKYEMDYIVVSKSYKYYDEATKKISKIQDLRKVSSLETADIYKVD